MSKRTNTMTYTIPDSPTESFSISYILSILTSMIDFDIREYLTGFVTTAIVWPVCLLIVFFGLKYINRSIREIRETTLARKIA